MYKFIRILKLIHRLNPWTMLHLFFFQLGTLLKPYLLLFFSGQIINQLVADAPYEEVLRNVFLFIGLSFAISILTDIFRSLKDISTTEITYRLGDALTKKSLVMDYQALNDPENRLKFQRAEEGSNAGGGIFSFLNYFLGFIFTLIISLAVAGTAIIRLAFSQATETSPLTVFTDSPLFLLSILLLILIPLILSVYTNHRSAKLQLRFFESITQINREGAYYSNTILSDNESGKTIRLYHAKDMIVGVMRKSMHYFIDSAGKMINKVILYNGFAQIITIMATGVLYLLVGMKAIVGAISIGSVLIYAGYIQTLVNTLVTGMGQFTNAQNILNYLQYYMDYLDLPEHHQGTSSLADTENLEFRFEHVSFSYPKTGIKVLDDVSLSIHQHERIAIVGQNGAGKTTFIKLLCRLYQPTEGKITLNGVDINTLDYEAYMKLLAVVFQDFNLYPFAIADNIALGESMNEARIEESLKLTGVYDKVIRLEKGIHTSIKGQFDEGVDLSGGEAQKIAIARAWYKDSPLVILDEPTASLDPISEYEIYKNFDMLMRDKTAIYVSHRMSSCKFCDRILVFEKGRIIQDGNHNTLIKEDNLYAELFNAQAQYYI